MDGHDPCVLMYPVVIKYSKDYTSPLRIEYGSEATIYVKRGIYPLNEDANHVDDPRNYA